ncbi:hypothetical protein BGZ74_005442, partial [Mortierella antarctica]
MGPGQGDYTKLKEDLKNEPHSERFDLGDALVMRWSTKEGKDNVADCLADAFR